MTRPSGVRRRAVPRAASALLILSRSSTATAFLCPNIRSATTVSLQSQVQVPSTTTTATSTSTALFDKQDSDDNEAEQQNQKQKTSKNSSGLGAYLDFIKQSMDKTEGSLQNTKEFSDVSSNIDFSIEALKKNIADGEFGKRGEQYVLAQFAVLACIALGTVPFVGDIITLTLGPALIGSSLVVLYKSAFDLGENLSPWPAPADPKTGRGSLIDTGIYAYMRHPMYSGLLFGMFGLSIATDSVMRLLLTFVLYLVLDRKSDAEECKLIETYGEAYTDYLYAVEGKFIPKKVSSWFNEQVGIENNIKESLILDVSSSPTINEIGKTTGSDNGEQNVRISSFTNEEENKN